MIDKARLAAYNGVKRIFGGAYSNLILPDSSLEGIHRAFAENIMLGTVERKLTLEYILSKYLARETNQDIVTLLMTGAFQILYMNKVPQNSACDETVKIAKYIFGTKYSGLVNAVMRNVCRNKDQIINDIDCAEGYIKYSVNKELFNMLSCQYPNDYDKIFNSFFGKAPTFIKVNSIKSDDVSVAKLINGEIIHTGCIKVNDCTMAVNNINSGMYFIQGKASQKAVELLDAQPHETVIDVCACPGGKTLSCAIKMQNKGKILSFDIHENKLPLISKSALNLGIDIIEAAKHDARFVKEELIGTADRVICDVPCSGTGVMGSKPEIKYKSPEDFKGLYKTQNAIIFSASKYLKIGGVMVYSTCSINKKENEEIIEYFLTNNKNFKLLHHETCMPYDTDCEGFYMAKLVREK